MRSYEVSLLPALCPSNDVFSIPDRLAFVRSRVMEIYMGSCEAVQICQKILTCLLEDRSVVTPCQQLENAEESAHDEPLDTSRACRGAAASRNSNPTIFLLLVQELSLQTTRSKHGHWDWLRRFVSDYVGREGFQSPKLPQLLQYCYLLPPELLWGIDRGCQTQNVTASLDQVWTFIEQVMLPLQPWDASLATHVAHGILASVDNSGGLSAATLHTWSLKRPMLIAALFTPNWRRVIGMGLAVLGKQVRPNMHSGGEQNSVNLVCGAGATHDLWHLGASPKFC
jgi:hypothetical protein